MKVTVIDYGLSNLLSVRHAFAHFGAETLLTSDPADVLAAEKLVLPGVGAFKDGMDGLARLGLIEPIRQKAAAGTPLLGICLGMQMLFDESEEFGLHKGLGLIPGRVVKIPDTDWTAIRRRCRTSAGIRSTPAAGARIFPARRWPRSSPARSAILSTATRPSPSAMRTVWPTPSTAGARSAPPRATAASSAASSTRKNPVRSG